MTVVLPNEFLTLNADESSEKAVIKLVKTVMNSDVSVSVTSLKGGITNQLLLAEQNGIKLLVRAFGKGTGSFIDRDRELAVHQQLEAIGLAPKLYGKFGNGLIYGYIPGKPTTADQLDNPDVMKQVSRRLAQWHATLMPEKVAAQLPNGLGNFWSVLEKWVDLCPEGVLQLSRNELKKEFEKLKSRIRSLGGAEVMGHCDLLSANILLSEDKTHLNGNGTENENDANKTHGVSAVNGSNTIACLPAVPKGTDPKIYDSVASTAAFIDYEYSIPCPRAFDIANHFQEWQGYECNKSRVPEPTLASPKLRDWCFEYLNAYCLLTNRAQDYESLVTELQAFWGMPGFYWGVWSAIQSQSSDIDFGYHHYASNRFQEYLDWKTKWHMGA